MRCQIKEKVFAKRSSLPDPVCRRQFRQCDKQSFPHPDAPAENNNILMRSLGIVTVCCMNTLCYRTEMANGNCAKSETKRTSTRIDFHLRFCTDEGRGADGGGEDAGYHPACL